jgi:hypothetical protein
MNLTEKRYAVDRVNEEVREVRTKIGTFYRNKEETEIAPLREQIEAIESDKWPNATELVFKKGLKIKSEVNRYHWYPNQFFTQESLKAVNDAVKDVEGNLDEKSKAVRKKMNDISTKINDQADKKNKELNVLRKATCDSIMLEGNAASIESLLNKIKNFKVG